MNQTHEVFVGVHIPKCAGTSLLERVQAVLPGEAVYQNTAYLINWEEGYMEFMSRNLRPLRFVWGHFITEEMLRAIPGPVVLMMGLREPHSRMQSEILQQRRSLRAQGKTEEEIHAGILAGLRKRWNPITMQILQSFPTLPEEKPPLKRAVQILESCDVWFADNFEQVATLIFQRMGITPPKVDANVSTAQEIAHELELEEWRKLAGIDATFWELDEQLYKEARQLFAGSTTQTIRPERRDALAAFRQQPVDQETLRKRILDGAAAQYNAWQVLDKVIDDRKRSITELQAEVDHLLAWQTSNAAASRG